MLQWSLYLLPLLDLVLTLEPCVSALLRIIIIIIIIIIIVIDGQA